jgi:hypothetical protein
VSADENGPTRRHSQTVLDLADGEGMHWDGEFDTLRELLVARLAPRAEALELARELLQRRFDEAVTGERGPDPAEFARRMQSVAPPYYGPDAPSSGSGRDPVAQRVARDGYYSVGFSRAYGTSRVTAERIIDAIHTYVLSLRSGASAYDRYAGGDPGALDPAERRGLALFVGKANCASCHDPGRNFSDGGFHSTGVGTRTAARGFADVRDGRDGGRGAATFVAADLGLYKTPGLRDAARRPPYMHDGSLATLEEVVAYYDRGGTPHPGLDARIRPLGLDAAEAADLVAFLRALASDERPGVGPPRRRPERTTVHVRDVFGQPVRGLEVEVRPFGDRLGARASKEPLRLVTDGAGAIRFAFPDWTHVVLAAQGTELGLDRPIPDYVRSARVLAAGRGRVLLRLVAPAGVARMPSRVRAGETDFVRLRELRGNVAYYVADASPRTGRVTVALDYAPRGAVAVPRPIDMTGGETEPIDLRE